MKHLSQISFGNVTDDGQSSASQSLPPQIQSKIKIPQQAFWRRSRRVADGWIFESSSGGSAKILLADVYSALEKIDPNFVAINKTNSKD